MEINSVIQNLNVWAVLAAAVSLFVLGGIWYGIFEKQWMSSNHFTKTDLEKRNMSVVFGLSFLLSLIIAFNLAMFIGQEGFMFGLFAGFMAGFGWVALAIGIIALFENRSLKYVLINGGYMVISFTIMGAIIGAWQ